MKGKTVNLFKLLAIMCVLGSVHLGASSGVVVSKAWPEGVRNPKDIFKTSSSKTFLHEYTQFDLCLYKGCAQRVLEIWKNNLDNTDRFFLLAFVEGMVTRAGAIFKEESVSKIKSLILGLCLHNKCFKRDLSDSDIGVIRRCYFDEIDSLSITKGAHTVLKGTLRAFVIYWIAESRNKRALDEAWTYMRAMS